MNKSPLYRILVYGLDAKGIIAHQSPVLQGKYALEFYSRKETPRFQDADGVIIFQGSCESFERGSNGFQSYLKHKWDRDELDKRTKETVALLDNGGFVCLLLTDVFIDFDERRDLRETDLSKRLLAGFTRTPLRSRMPMVTSKVNELIEFFSLYGAAWTSITQGSNTPPKTLATAGGYAVSIVAHDSLFVIPTLLPHADAASTEEYFVTLADGVVSLWERLQSQLPEWAARFRFAGEDKIVDARQRLSEEMAALEDSLARFERLKRVLVLQGEPLVEAVMELFEDIFPLKPRREEAFREDLTLVNSAGKTMALAEIKGVSRGVAREHVNQADSHRERNGFPVDFPSLLIINTAMKTASSIADKDQAVALEQVQHAVRNNILIVRTLDLLNLASLHLSGGIDSETVINLLTKSKGWLKVGDSAQIVTG